MNNYIAFYDTETGSKNPFRTQPLQLACVMIDQRTLSIVNRSVFQSLIKPEFDLEKCEKENLDPVQDDALKVNNISRESLANAPELSVVWNNFCSYLQDYNLKGKTGGKWDQPIRAGFNIVNFDNTILYRLCNKFGPKPDEYGGMTLFHPFHQWDVQMLAATWFHSMNFRSVGMDSMREFMGINKEGAHNAIVDVLQGAYILIKFLRLHKLIVNGEINLPLGKKVKFKNCFETENEEIKRIISEL